LKASLKIIPHNQFRVGLVGFMILLALFIYYNQLYTSLARVNEALAAEFESKEALLHDFQARGYNDIAGLAEQEKIIRSQIENLHDEVPGYLDEPGVLVDIYRLVRENNLGAEKIVFDQYQQDNGFGRLPFDLTVDGNASSVYCFIKQLEGFHRLIRVGEVEFKPDNGGWVSCRVRAEFYVLGEPDSEPRVHSFSLNKTDAEPAYSILQPTLGNGSNFGGTTGNKTNTANPTENRPSVNDDEDNQNIPDIPFTK